jgi:hypothetical protein
MVVVVVCAVSACAARYNTGIHARWMHELYNKSIGGQDERFDRANEAAKEKCDGGSKFFTRHYFDDNGNVQRLRSAIKDLKSDDQSQAFIGLVQATMSGTCQP